MQACEERACPATFTPVTVADFVAAITTASDNNQSDTINLTNTIYAFSSPVGGNALPVIPDDNGTTITINGNGATLTLATQSELMRFFAVNGGRLVLNQLTLAGGYAEFGDGGAVLVEEGRLEVNGVLFRNNTADFNGGAVAFLNNTTEGFLANCTFTQNLAGASNESFGVQGGGAIYVNMAEPPDPEATITIRSCTIVDNTVGFLARIIGESEYGGGGVLLSSGGTILIENSIVANNLTFGEPDNVYQGTFFDEQTQETFFDGEIGARNSLIQDSLTFVNAGQIALLPVAANPNLGPLANNGGLTQTMAILTGSLCINAGDNAFVTGTTDQRGTGFARVRGGTVDIGAFETQPLVAVVKLKQSLAQTRLGKPVTFTMTVKPDNVESPIPTGTVTFFDGHLLLGTVELVNGKATLKTSKLALGSHRIRAVYSGDTNYDMTSRTLVHRVVAPFTGRRWDR